MPGPRTRRTTRLRLGTTSARTQPILDDPPVLPPLLVAVGGGLASALAGVLLVAGVVLVGWWGAASVPVPAMLTAAGQLWLLGHGGTLPVGGLRITLVPLGLTVVFAMLSAATGAYAFQQAARARPRPAAGRELVRMLLTVCAELALGYTVAAVAVALLTGVPVPAALPGAMAVSLLGGLAGAWWRSNWRPPLPVWLRAAGTGAAAGLAVVVGLAAVALAVALIQGETRIASLEQELGLDTVGGVVWAVVGLCYLPTLLGWVAAWLLGAGFSVGDGSLVAPWTTQLGLLPTIPVLGALPGDGIAGLEAWLASGGLAGIAAGIVAVLTVARGRAARPDPVTGIGTGGLAGLLAGIGCLVWAALSRGSLGVDRFALVGPRFPEMLIGLGTLTIGAALGAAAAWIWLSRKGAGGVR